MAVNLNALAEVQTVGSNQNMLLFGDNNVATRIDYDKLAEAILNKTRDEIGGVSPISAIAALNSSVTFPEQYSSGDLNTIYDSAANQTFRIFVVNNVVANTPSAGEWIIFQKRQYAGYGLQLAMHTDGTDIWIRRKYSTWMAWEKLPTRSEIDALNSRLPITFTVFNDRITVIDQNCFRVGNMVYINIRGKTNQNFTENTMIQGLPTPSTTQYIPVNISGAFAKITASSNTGLIADGITSDTNFVISGVYFAN